MPPSLIFLCVALLTFSVTYWLISNPSERGCSVIITGESVRIIGCDLTPELLDFALRAEVKVIKIP